MSQRRGGELTLTGCRKGLKLDPEPKVRVMLEKAVARLSGD
ncbi:hypothetical protein [Novosphingobium sp.]|nr:hypothetical protein [Novosphingobium sp.]